MTPTVRIKRAFWTGRYLATNFAATTGGTVYDEEAIGRAEHEEAATRSRHERDRNLFLRVMLMASLPCTILADRAYPDNAGSAFLAFVFLMVFAAPWVALAAVGL